MRLKTKLVLAATGLTFAIVLMLSAAVCERADAAEDRADGGGERCAGAPGLLMTRQAVEDGAAGESSGRTGATRRCMRRWWMRCGAMQPLADVMNAIVRYSPTVQDVSVTDAHGMTLVSTDPDALNQPAPFRFSLASVQDGGVALPDAGGVRQAAGAGYFAGAGPEWGAVSGGACGGAVDVFEELV